MDVISEINKLTALLFSTRKKTKDNTQDISELSARGISVKAYGAKGDGATNDTAAFNACTAAANSLGINAVFVPAGTYMIQGWEADATAINVLHDKGGIKLYDNMTLELLPGAILKQITTDKAAYQVIRIYNKQNVTIRGGKIVGDLDTHTGGTGEWGYGISVQGGSNILIENVTVESCWGDGLNVQVLYTDLTPPDRVTIRNVISDGNRRQGLSIEGGKHVVVENSSFINTAGTNPRSGIDIEPYTKTVGTYYVQDVTINNCRLADNEACAVLIDGVSVDDVKIIGCYIFGNENTQGQIMTYEARNILVRGCTFVGNGSYDAVRIQGNIGHRVIENVFYDSSVTIAGATTNATIKGCLIHGNKFKRTDATFTGTILVDATSYDARIIGNDIEATDAANTGSAIVINGKNSLVSLNHIIGFKFGALISGDHTELSNNFIEDCWGNAAVLGAVSAEVFGNKIAGSCWGNNGGPDVVLSAQANGCRIINNTFCQDPISGIARGENKSGYIVLLKSGATNNIVDNNRITQPTTHGFVGNSSGVTTNILIPINGNMVGTTGQRPTANIDVGFKYVDTTVGAQIMWGGSGWL